MKRTGTGLVVVTVAVCMLLSVGVASKSFAQILWVASVDTRIGYLPVYAEPTENSSIVGSLQRCTRVLLTGAGKGPLVEISQPMQGWVQADLLGENSCSAGYVEPEEPTVIGTAPVGRIYGPSFTAAIIGLNMGITLRIMADITEGIMEDIMALILPAAGITVAITADIIRIASCTPRRWYETGMIFGSHKIQQGGLRPPFAFYEAYLRFPHRAKPERKKCGGIGLKGKRR